MKLTEFKRIKFGQMPGEINRQLKILMREKHTPIEVFPWQIINEKCAKVFRRFLQDKSRTIQRRRDKRAIKDGLE